MSFIIIFFGLYKGVEATAVSSNLSPYRTVPYLYQTLKTNFAKTARQKLKVKLYSHRARLTL